MATLEATQHRPSTASADISATDHQYPPFQWAPDTSLHASLIESVRAAISAIPLQHLQPLSRHECYVSTEAGHIWVQDYTFSRGFAVVVESKNKTRLRLQCIHHKGHTRNTRGHGEEIDESTRQRNTSVKGNGCR